MAWQPDYVTVDELAEYVGINDDADNTTLAFAVSAASRIVDNYTRRQFGFIQEGEARRYSAEYHTRLRRWEIEVDDVMTGGGMQVNVDLDGDGTFEETVDGLFMEPLNNTAKGLPWTRIVVSPTSLIQPNGDPGAVEVTARWGWTDVPTSVHQATLLQASRLWKRKFAPFGVAGSPEAGSVVRLLARVDPDVAVALEPYRKRARPQ